MNCHYDREQDTYLRDGEPCTHDEYGDPTRHCTARRNCASHIGADELTCARCIGRTRAALRRVVEASALLLPVAISEGCNSEAANLAGPAADPETYAARRSIDRGWIMDHLPNTRWDAAMSALLEDDDERHPYGVLARWEAMVREDYGHERDTPTSIAAAADYLERQLPRIAQDDEQDWPLFAREIGKLRNHLMSALRRVHRPERGAPCPECAAADVKVFARLVREYGHWCDDGDCTRLHYIDDGADEWVCPRNRKEHRWTHADYTRWIEDRQAG